MTECSGFAVKRGGPAAELTSQVQAIQLGLRLPPQVLGGPTETPVSISAGESSSAVGCRAGDVWLYRSQHSPLLSPLLPSRPVCPSQRHVGPSLPRSLFPGLPGVTLYSCGHSRKPSPGPELWPFTLTLEVVGFFTFLFSLFTFYFVLGYSQLTNNTSLVAQTVKRLPAMRETQI